MNNLSKAIIFSAVLVVGLGVCSGQDSDKNENELTKASEVQAALKQWVLTRQLIAKEQSAWEEMQATLSDLNEVRQREVKQLGEFSKAAGMRISEIDKRRKQFTDEETELKSWRRTLKTQVRVLENELRPLIPLFPAPLRAKVEEAIVRIGASDPERALQHRIRDVLLVMQACLSFQNTITLDADIRVIDGKEREVEVLYLGLTQAWYVDLTGQYSGYGSPGLKGWIWKDEPALASSVRQAIAIQGRQANPDFVTLPITNAAAGSETE